MISKTLRNLLLVAPACFGAALVVSNPALADQPASGNSLEQVANYANGNNSGGVASLEKVADYSSGVKIGNTVTQVTSVSQFSDVKPTDWAFQALQSLVERYGCIVGYPDKTFRGNRALTRYEFAAGLNACINRINELIAASTADLVKKDDLDELQKLQEEFASELAQLQGRVASLEGRVGTLEKQQFSTTTKLNGEVIFGVSGVIGDDRALTSEQQRIVDAAPTALARQRLLTNIYGSDAGVQENTTFGTRARLALDTSFTGKDRLRTQLQARNITPFSGGVTGTNQTRLSYDGDEGGTFNLRRVEYRFPVGDLITLFVGTGAGNSGDGLEFNDMVPTLSPVESSGQGAISRFGRFNPIYRGTVGAGALANIRLGRGNTLGSAFTLSAGYLVPSSTANNPADKAGLFDGQFTALAQLAFQPSRDFGAAFTYTRSYYPGGSGVTGSTGTGFANNPFNGAATSADSFGAQASIRLFPGLILSGWGGYTRATAKEQINTISVANITGIGNVTYGSALDPVVRRDDEADIWNWAVSLAFPDLFKKGNLAGIVFGMPPRVGQNDFGTNTTARLANSVIPRRRDGDTTYHIEGFFRYRLNDNISVTPGLLVILNPEGNSDNDTIFVGTVRTTFTF